MKKVSVAALVVFAVAYAVFLKVQPKTFRVTRSVVISAAAAEIFPHLNDLRKAKAWLPWTASLSPVRVTAQRDGEYLRWEGLGLVSNGRVTIHERRPPEFVRLRVVFEHPTGKRYQEWICFADLTLKPAGNRTEATWTMWGDTHPDAMLLFFLDNQQQLMGGEFEHALETLKAMVETSAGKRTAALP